MRTSLKLFLRVSVSCALAIGIWAVRTQSQGESVPSSLLDSSGYIREEAYLPSPPLPAADACYAKRGGRHIKVDYLKPITDISLKSRDDGNRYWGRIAGTKYEQMTSDLLAANFRKLGLCDIHTQDFALPSQWFAIDWNV